MGAVRRRRAALTIALAIIAAATAAWVPPATAAPQGLPAGFTDTVWWTTPAGYSSPTQVAFAPDGQLFVAMKDGRVLQFDDVNDTTPAVFADLRTDVYSLWDHGMLGIVVDPAWPARPYVYVRYTLDAPPGSQSPYWNDVCPSPPGVNEDGCTTQSRVSRLTANGAAPAIEKVLVQGWCYPGPSHGPGTLRFGSDGYLYAGSGDGQLLVAADYGQRGSPANPCGDAPSAVGTKLTLPTTQGGSLRSQDLTTPNDPVSLDGALIRINPDTGAGAPGNPLASSTDANARRIIAYGFRNPYRFAFAPGTNELYVADVGQGDFEEIDRVPNPSDATVENFGWPCYEGTGQNATWAALGTDVCNGLYASPGAVTDPYYSYPHTGASFPADCADGQGAITAITVHSLSSWPAEYQGALFFSDYTRGCTFVMPRGADGRPDPTNVSLFSAQTSSVVDLVEGPDGDLWYTSLGTCKCIRRIHHSDGNAPPIAAIDASPTYGPVPLTVHLSAARSRDPEGGAVTYSWDVNGDGVFGDATGVAPTRTYTAFRALRVSVRVRDSKGATSTTSMMLYPGNAPPKVSLTRPAATLKFAVGDTIPFAATATNVQGVAIGPARFHWELVQHHCTGDLTSCHEHVAATADGVKSGSFIAPSHGYPSYLDVRLTVTNSAGMSTTVTRRVDPKVALVTLKANVTNAQLRFDEVAGMSPLKAQAIVRSTGVASASVTSKAGAPFGSWSNGGARVQQVTVPAAGVTITATYGPAP